jgi:OsmC subfamily peroxiredoxin
MSASSRRESDHRPAANPRGGSVRYFFENYALDTDRRELQRGTDVVPTTPQVFDLLDYLIRNRERVVGKDDLVIAIWKGRIVSDAALTTRLSAARSVIGDSGEEQRLIKTLPRKGYRFVGAVHETNLPSGTETVPDSRFESSTPALALPDKPSIAVLPFENLSGDAEQEYFADGMVEEITIALSRFKSLRLGSTTWNGGLREGKGAASTESRALQNYPYSLFTRYGEKPGTNPEELLGAAHAACFTMSFVRILGMANFVPEQVDSKSDVVIERDGDGFSITSVRLTVTARIPGIDRAAFESIAAKAKACCPVSKLMNAEIGFEATLVS